MAEIAIKIEGMSCQHCVMSVKNAIDGLDGINSSDVTVGLAKVIYDDSKTSNDTIIQAVKNAGYNNYPANL
jgi:copper chaperone CopZ